MTNKVLVTLLPLLAIQSSSAWDWNNNADMQFYAPGMGNNPVIQTQVSGGGSGNQHIGSYYAYVIKGISGSLTLGNRNLHDEYSDTSSLPSYIRPWSASSWATFGFQINNTFFSQPELHLSVSGSSAGVSTGVVTQLLDSPLVLRSKGTSDVFITFVPHVNGFFLPSGEGISNRTPSGRLAVLADIYREPPEPTGKIMTSEVAVFPTQSITLSWEYDQGENALLEGSSSLGAPIPVSLEGGTPINQ